MKPPDVSHRDLLKTDEQQCRVKKRYVKIGRNYLWGLTCRLAVSRFADRSISRDVCSQRDEKLG